MLLRQGKGDFIPQPLGHGMKSPYIYLVEQQSCAPPVGHVLRCALWVYYIRISTGPQQFYIPALRRDPVFTDAYLRNPFLTNEKIPSIMVASDGKKKRRGGRGVRSRAPQERTAPRLKGGFGRLLRKVASEPGC
jgi:hypothetical protein